MKKIKFLISNFNNLPVELMVPDFSSAKNKAGMVALKLLTLLNQYVFFIFLFLLPLSPFFFNSAVGYETSTLYYVILFIIFLVAIYFSTVILGGKKKLIDPPFFLSILVFSLGITTSVILTTPANIVNTFGIRETATIASFRGTAGIM